MSMPSVGTVPVNFVFHVGPHEYRVVFVRDLEDEEGNPLMGRTDPNRFIIYLHAAHPSGSLEQTIVHELTHAWDAACGAPRDREGEADRNSTLWIALRKDLGDQGGMAALHRERRRFSATMATIQREPGDHLYVPLEDVDRDDMQRPAHGKRAGCSMCHQTVPDSAVVDGPHHYDRAIGGTIVRRTMYCGHCRHLQSWDEGVYMGMPNTEVARGPYHVTGPEVAAFLAQYPRAAALVP